MASSGDFSPTLIGCFFLTLFGGFHPTLTAMSENYSSIERFIAYFNGNNPRYVATIKYYDEPTQLAADIASGNSPDVLEMTFINIPLTDANYIDMRPLLLQDDELSETIFTGNIYNAMTVNGQWLYAIDFFSLSTVIGRASDVGTVPGWTMPVMQQIMSEKGGKSTAFPEWLTPDELLLWVAYVAAGDYVNYNNYTCSFDSGEFIALLEMCGTRPPDRGMYPDDYAEEVLLTIEMLERSVRIEAISDNYGLSDYTYIGFPGDGERCGSFYSRIDDGLFLAIPAGTDNVEGAWEFVKAMYEDGWQGRETGIPAIRHSFEAAFEDLLTEMDGISYEKDYWKLVDILNRTEAFVFYDQSIRNIIIEEAQMYFSGDRSAADAAAMIQRRVSLYLAEKQ